MHTYMYMYMLYIQCHVHVHVHCILLVHVYVATVAPKVVIASIHVSGGLEAVEGLTPTVMVVAVQTCIRCWCLHISKLLTCCSLNM